MVWSSERVSGRSRVLKAAVVLARVFEGSAGGKGAASERGGVEVGGGRSWVLKAAVILAWVIEGSTGGKGASSERGG